jgi:hypothetical protein
MLTLDTAFDRIGSALQHRGYKFAKAETETDSGDRAATFQSPNTTVRVFWKGRARLLILQVQVNGEWVEFARRGFGPSGLEDTAVDALVRAVSNEVAETSTDSD